MAAGLVFLLLPGSYLDNLGREVAFSSAGRLTAAAGAWMAIWWITEAIPVYATALLPLALLPAGGAVSMRETAAPYAHELIFLFMGGFVIALSMQRWGLHRRFALTVVRLAGAAPHRMVGGFMLVTALVSMWVSNTATAMMMLPIATSVIETVQPGGDPGPERRNFSLCMLLGIAYAASIGGIGTLIGTPPNLFMASYVKDIFGIEIGFARWMAIGIPLVAVFLPVTWLLLTRVLFPFRMTRIDGGPGLDSSYRELGVMKRGEWITLIVSALTAAAWITRPLLSRIQVAGMRPLSGLTDTGIAMIAALSLFMIPVDIKSRTFAMNWETAAGLPWGLLLLFGGGLSLASAIEANGVGELIGHRAGALAGLPGVAIVVLITAMMITITELTSNTASAATLLPILGALAPGLGVHPLLLVIPAAIAASCGFMLPVATPPNAIVFGSGRVSIPQMCRAGVWLNVAGVILITGLAYAVILPVMGIGPGPQAAP